MRDENRPELSIVIPCFNEEDNVRAICAAVRAEAEHHASSYEILLIDNASTDRTRAILRELCAEHPTIRAILNNRNYGQMRSPTHGLYQAAGRAVIGMCADFQDPPSLIGEFLRHWRAGAQVVLGQRRSEASSWPVRTARRLGYGFLARFGDYPVIPGATGFGLFDRAVIDALRQWNEPEPFFRGMVVESGFRLAIVPFDRPPRAAGESKNDFATLFAFALSGLATAGKSLLRMPVLFAFWAGGLTLALLAATIAAALLGGPGWPLAAMTLAMAMFSVVLLYLGLMGEQLRLIAERGRNLPLVIEEERINFPPERGAPHRA